MSGQALGTVILAIIVIAVAIAIVAYIFHWLYRRSSKETAFVRTGLGGQKVVINGGAFVLPIIHDVTPVNMSTIRLEVRRGQQSALITKNRMRVDVVAEFYARVKPATDAVSVAAQTLGRRTMDTEKLRELLEGRFVDPLRAVAAEMTMEEMHEKRGEFVRRVRQSVEQSLAQNGLELESVSLTGLDQTNMEYFNPSNAFDAEGLTQLTEEIERRKKIRNDIEQDTLIQIRNKNLEAEKISLEIDRDTEYARLAQEQEVESRRAAQRAILASERAERDREAREAEIKAHEQLERARIAQERAIETDRIGREGDIQRLEIEHRKLLEIAEQQRAIAIAEQSRAQSEAQATAETARAKAISAEEKVFSAREIEIAERQKQIELLKASQDAERDAIRIKIAAGAEKAAAVDRAQASKTEAEGLADAEKIRALAAKLRYEIDAEGARQMNEAQNVLSPASRASNARMRLIEKLDAIIRESVKPMEKIEGIRILHVDGLGGAPARGGDGQPQGAGFADQLVNSALRYRAQAPLIDQMLKEIGISGGDISKIAEALAEAQPALEGDDGDDTSRRGRR
jgi:uncharacterized membrane protein YqiK